MSSCGRGIVEQAEKHVSKRNVKVNEINGVPGSPSFALVLVCIVVVAVSGGGGGTKRWW